jgi:hypothetical protein
MAATWLSLLLQALAVPFSADFWKKLIPGLKALWRAIHAWLCRLMKGEWQAPRRPSRQGCCIDLPPDVYKRADPLIYSQYYLMAQGLAVTWDNPDIDIFDGATPITGPLQPGKRYRVRVRVWNGSYDAPAVGVGVALSYLSFGAQTVSHPIAATSINLGAKGTIDHPAFAEFEWVTPDAGGHYCLQAQLSWADDANPDNNLGQKNINVAAAQSPARFSFVVRNGASVPRRFALEADAYGLRAPPPCREEGERPKTRLQESRSRWERARREQGYGQFPLPADWTVEITPQAFGLDPRQEQTVDVAIEPRDPAFRGAKSFNVHVFAMDEQLGKRLTGGVTLTATKA